MKRSVNTASKDTSTKRDHYFAGLKFCVCVYLFVGVQRYASSSWFEPLLSLQSPVWPRLDCQRVPSLCGHSRPTHARQKRRKQMTHGAKLNAKATVHAHYHTLMVPWAETPVLLGISGQMSRKKWCNTPGKRAAASQGSRKMDVWAHRRWRGGTRPLRRSFAQSGFVLWRHLIRGRGSFKGFMHYERHFILRGSGYSRTLLL